MADVTAFSLSEVEEGSEPDEFWKAIGGKKFYCSLAHGKFQDSSANIKVKAAIDRIKGRSFTVFTIQTIPYVRTAQ